MPLEWFLIVSGLLFGIGMTGVLTRRNIFVIFMSAELMLNAVNLSLVGFNRALNSFAGQSFVVFILTVAAAEAAVGLALIVALQRRKDTVDIEAIQTLRQ
ncbi:MAG: NADH-quinone oxidoreductase subunit NuoK [Chloroflexi bacterium]|nr:NADH-quinone oxidoreductase subunit NuoK [Chloroflexota bacterium]